MKTMREPILYYGCHRESGHYFWEPGMQKRHYGDAPFGNFVDCGFLPEDGNQLEGQVYLTHILGLTVFAFWDRSVDRRPGSHSTFILRGIYSFDEALTHLKDYFPEVLSRLHFKLVEVK